MSNKPTFIEVEPETESDWLELRTKVVTATETGVLLGFNKWKSVAQLIESKSKIEHFENAYTWLGQALEPVIVLATNKVLNTNFQLFEDVSRSFFLSEELRIGATPDAVEGPILLECKSTKPKNFYTWKNWPPAYYLTQLYTQLVCTERQVGYLAIMSTNLSQSSEVLELPINIYEITRTEELDDILLTTVDAFWKACDVDKLYRVNRKGAATLEFKFRAVTKKIY